MKSKRVRSFMVIFLLVFVILLPGCRQTETEDSEQSIEDEQDAEDVEEVYMEIEVTGDRLAIRKTPGTSNKPAGDVLERVDKGQVLVLHSKHDNTVNLDGYIWWEVYNPSSNITGWSAAKYLSE